MYIVNADIHRGRKKTILDIFHCNFSRPTDSWISIIFLAETYIKELSASNDSVIIIHLVLLSTFLCYLIKTG